MSDLVQDVFLAMQQLARSTQARPLAGWLATIAKSRHRPLRRALRMVGCHRILRPPGDRRGDLRAGCDSQPARYVRETRALRLVEGMTGGNRRAQG